MMAAMASKKDPYGARPPPPPISQSTAPIQIYDVIDEHPDDPQVRMRNHQQQQQQQQQNRRSGVPPAPLAGEDNNDYYIEPAEQDGEYMDTEYRRGRKEVRGGPQDRHYQDAQDKRRSQDAYYLDTAAASPNRNSAYHGHGTQDHYQGRYEIPSGPYSQEIYEAPPFDDEDYDQRRYPYDYQERRPVDRRESRKKMGVAIMAGLNTARVKEVKQRLRPAFGPDEVIEGMERRSQAASGTPSAADDLDQIDVSGLSIAARMKLLEAKQKPVPPPTYPKSRPKNPTAVTAAAGAQVPHHHHNPGAAGQLPGFGTDVPVGGGGGGAGVDIRRHHPVAGPPPDSGSPHRSPRTSSRLSMEDAPWFFGSYEQHRSEDKLRNLNKEGAFIIRISKKGEARSQPFTLCIFHENDVYNLMIRQKMNQKYAVGTEKPGEPEFGSLADLVKFHADIPIEVMSKTDAGRATGVWLTMSPLK